MEKWTKGPWSIQAVAGEYDLSGVPFIAVKIGECGVLGYKETAHIQCSLDDDDNFYLSEEDVANAHLIAAAPELYTVLSDICQEFAQQHPLIKRGAAALAKACGESQ